MTLKKRHSFRKWDAKYFEPFTLSVVLIWDKQDSLRGFKSAMARYHWLGDSQLWRLVSEI